MCVRVPGLSWPHNLQFGLNFHLVQILHHLRTPITVFVEHLCFQGSSFQTLSFEMLIITKTSQHTVSIMRSSPLFTTMTAHPSQPQASTPLGNLRGQFVYHSEHSPNSSLLELFEKELRQHRPAFHNKRTQQGARRDTTTEAQELTAAAPCSGTSTQAPKRTQQRHLAAAPAPKVPSAHTSGNLQWHQHQRSQAHTPAATCSGTSTKGPKRTHQRQPAVAPAPNPSSQPHTAL